MGLVEYLKQKRVMRKILVAGSGAVGKTSLVKVLASNKSLSELGNEYLEYHRTHFLEMETISADKISANSKGTFYFYDVAGQIDLPIHALRDTASTVVGAVDLVLLVFSNDNAKSLLELSKWFSLIENALKQARLVKEPTFVLIKNKIDLPSRLDDSLVEHLLAATPRIVKYFEVSCLTGQGLDDLKKWLLSFLKGGSRA